MLYGIRSTNGGTFKVWNTTKMSMTCFSFKMAGSLNDLRLRNRALSRAKLGGGGPKLISGEGFWFM